MGARGGVDLGGTKIQAVVVDRESNILGQSRRPTPREGGPPGVASEIVETLREAAREAELDPTDLTGIGVGSPGAIDSSAGTIEQARNLPDWIDPFPLGSFLSEELGPPVTLGNDVGVAVDAEAALGVGREYSSFIGVFWGTGVGGGVVLDGKQWMGRGAAGEIGHIVVRKGGASCGCGRRGCLEAYAGRASMEAEARREVGKGKHTKLFKIMEERGRNRLTSGVWARALRAEDHLAIKLMNRAVEALGAGIASTVNLLDVEAIVIGGGLGIRLGQPYVDRITEAMLPHLFLDDRPPAAQLASLGDLGGAIGAALLVEGATTAATSYPARAGSG